MFPDYLFLVTMVGSNLFHTQMVQGEREYLQTSVLSLVTSSELQV